MTYSPRDNAALSSVGDLVLVGLLDDAPVYFKHFAVHRIQCCYCIGSGPCFIQIWCCILMNRSSHSNGCLRRFFWDFFFCTGLGPQDLIGVMRQEMSGSHNTLVQPVLLNVLMSACKNGCVCYNVSKLLGRVMTACLRSISESGFDPHMKQNKYTGII